MWWWAKVWYENGMHTNTSQGKAEAIACCVHSLPLISSIVELMITKMVFLKKDAKWSLFIGLLYIPVNYYGSKWTDAPVYGYISYLNWHNFWQTFGIFFLQALIMPIVVYITAVITQHLHGFHEHSMEWKRDRKASTEEHNQNLLNDHDAK